MRAVRATVRGVVQGVGFRFAARAQAQRLGLNGWVRNEADGSVEVAAQGPADAVSDFVDWLRVGPDFAEVASVDVADTPVDPSLTGFEVAF